MKSLFALSTALLASALTLQAQEAPTYRTWNAGTTSTNFNQTSNYSPSGSLNADTHLIFDSATDPSLLAGTSVALDGFTFHSGATGFRLAGQALTLRNGGVSVAALTDVTFDLRLTSHSNATQLTFDVGNGGSLTANALVTPINRAFYKTGAGTLILTQGMGSTSENFLRTGTSINLQEGRIEIGNDALFQAGSTLTTLNIHLGTASSTAHLKGGGTFGGSTGKSAVLTTYGSARSIIEPAGDGSLYIQNLNASAGAEFRFALGSGVIEGSGTFTGSDIDGELLLDLTGGEVGVTYTLFEYGNLANIDASSFTLMNSAYQVDQWSIADGRVQVSFSAIPEPSLISLSILPLLGGILLYRRRKPLNRC